MSAKINKTILNLFQKNNNFEILFKIYNFRKFYIVNFLLYVFITYL